MQIVLRRPLLGRNPLATGVVMLIDQRPAYPREQKWSK
jgi:hypothetical protein